MIRITTAACAAAFTLAVSADAATYYARQRLIPLKPPSSQSDSSTGQQSGGLANLPAPPADGSGVPVSVSWVRNVGSLVAGAASKNLKTESLEDLGYRNVDGLAFRYSDGTGYIGSVNHVAIANYGPYRFLFMRIDDGVAHHALCAALNAASGGPNDYVRYSADEMAARGEGCGSNIYGVSYWRRI